MMKIIRFVFAAAIGVCAAVLMSGGIVLATVGFPPGIGTPVTIAVTPPDSTDPGVAYGGGLIHAVWVESSTIRYSQSAGVTWTTPVTVSAGTDPALVIDRNGRPHVAFTDFFSPTYNVYHTYLSGTWQLRQLVSNGTSNTSAPDAAAAPDGTLYVAWSQQVNTTTKAIELAESANDGASWPTVAPVPNANGSAPSIAVGSGGVIHVVWQDTAQTPYRIKHTESATSTWTIPALLSDASANSFGPDMIVSGGRAHVAWQQSSAIDYAHGSKLVWSAPFTLANGTVSAPAITENGYSALIAAWDAGVTITLRMGGVSGWGAAQTLGSNAAGIGQVNLATGPAGTVHAVFASGAPSSRDVVYNHFTTAAVFLPSVLKNTP